MKAVLRLLRSLQSPWRRGPLSFVWINVLYSRTSWNNHHQQFKSNISTISHKSINWLIILALVKNKTKHTGILLHSLPHAFHQHSKMEQNKQQKVWGPDCRRIPEQQSSQRRSSGNSLLFPTYLFLSVSRLWASVTEVILALVSGLLCPAWMSDDLLLHWAGRRTEAISTLPPPHQSPRQRSCP